jgi:hypothetical protein
MTDDFLATRPGTAATNLRNSYHPQPSRRTSSYSAYGVQPPATRERQDYREREYHTPPRDREPVDHDPRERELPVVRGESNGESSSASSYNQPYDQYHPSVHYPGQEYSPPSTPTRPQQFSPPPPSQFSPPQSSQHFPQSATQHYQSYGLPSPEPEVDSYPRVPVKPVHSFVTRPATPPSDVGVDKATEKKSKFGKLKRFSGLGKSKS